MVPSLDWIGVFCNLGELPLLLSVIIWIVSISVYTSQDACCGDQILPSQVKSSSQSHSATFFRYPVQVILVVASSHDDTHILTERSLNGDA